MFDLSRTETTQFNSILVSLSGFVGFAFLLTYVWTKIGKRIDNRIGAIIGVMICVGFLFTTYSWWFYSENIEHDGCHSPWCATTPKIPWELYAASYVIVFGVGFAMMNVHLASMYSGVCFSIHSIHRFISIPKFHGSSNFSRLIIRKHAQ
ncbi:hypothetical protein COOONC_10413 [Cooperia oncophora]